MDHSYLMVRYKWLSAFSQFLRQHRFKLTPVDYKRLADEIAVAFPTEEFVSINRTFI
jgi:putative IMPACT (imprinted ancient) family translation regulator